MSRPPSLTEASLGPHAPLLQQFMDTAPDAMVLVGEDGRIVVANRHIEQVFGHKPEALVGEYVEALIPERFRPKHPEHRTRFFNNPQVRPMGAGLLLYGLKRDGTEFPVEISLGPMRQQGRTYVTAAIRDVTDRQAAEQAIRKSQSQLAEAQSIAHIGSWEWDIADNHVEWSDELYRIYGLEPHSIEITYERFTELVHPDDRDEVNDTITKAFNDGQGFEFLHRIYRPNGEERMLHGRGNVITDADHKPVRMVGTAQDVTEQRHAQARIEQSLEEKEVLLKEIHHRVKNNLQVIASLLNLQSAQIADKTALSALQDSRNRVRSMALVHESLYQSDTFRGIDFKTYLERLIGELFRTYTARGTQIQLNVNACPARLDLDASMQAGLIVNELVSNALKHAYPDGGPGDLLVALTPEPHGGLALSVADNGVGIHDEKREGSLGMQLIERLTSQLGGRLDQDHTKGLTVTLHIPAKHVQEAPA